MTRRAAASNLKDRRARAGQESGEHPPSTYLRQPRAGHGRRAAQQARTLSAEHPSRFGWRFWILLPQHARLLTPHGYPNGAMSPHALAEADCTHGNTPPAPDCPCGIYYMPEWVMFRAFCGDILNRTEPASVDPERWLDLGLSIPFLAALQGVFDDEPPGPGSLAVSFALTFGAASQYRCPVIAGVHTCEAVEEAIASDRTVRSTLDALADQPVPAPDTTAKQWNARLLEKVIKPLNVPPPLLPEHIRSMLHSQYAAHQASWRPPAELT